MTPKKRARGRVGEHELRAMVEEATMDANDESDQVGFARQARRC
jgi:hypothetical protein